MAVSTSRSNSASLAYLSSRTCICRSSKLRRAANGACPGQAMRRAKWDDGLPGRELTPGRPPARTLGRQPTCNDPRARRAPLPSRSGAHGGRRPPIAAARPPSEPSDSQAVKRAGHRESPGEQPRVPGCQPARHCAGGRQGCVQQPAREPLQADVGQPGDVDLDRAGGRRVDAWSPPSATSTGVAARATARMRSRGRGAARGRAGSAAPRCPPTRVLRRRVRRRPG